LAVLHDISVTLSLEVGYKYPQFSYERYLKQIKGPG
jgi:hypothetical protein